MSWLSEGYVSSRQTTPSTYSGTPMRAARNRSDHQNTMKARDHVTQQSQVALKIIDRKFKPKPRLPGPNQTSRAHFPRSLPSVFAAHSARCPVFATHFLDCDTAERSNGWVCPTSTTTPTRVSTKRSCNDHPSDGLLG